MNIRVPTRGQGIKDSHWSCHIQNIERLAYLANHPVEHVKNSGETNPLVRMLPGKDRKVWTTPGGAPNMFSIVVDGKQVIIDFSDLTREGIDPAQFKSFPIIFKYHYYYDLDYQKNVFPLCAPLDIKSLGACKEFFGLCHSKIYTCNSDIVLSNQRPHTRALDRRRHVQGKLKQTYRENADVRFKKGYQREFWKKFRNCLVSVVVPGACNFMVDRGHLEQLALGVCTICPEIREYFPGSVILQPDVHYVKCANDYTDLIQKIEWCRKNREKCREIGNNAYRFYWDYCSPEPYWKWIGRVLK